MDDYISRQTAIDVAIKMFNAWYGHSLLRTNEIRARFEQQPSADVQPVHRWMPCSEITADGYPTEDGAYYVTEQNYGFYLDADFKRIVAHISRFKNGDFVDRFYDSNHSNITAWMPLPEPYKEDEE